PAAITREAVAGGVYDVDVAGTQRDAFFQQQCAFVDHRVQGTLLDFLRGGLALRDVQAPGFLLNQGDHLRVGRALALGAVVAVVAASGLLPEPAVFVEDRGRPVEARVLWQQMLAFQPGQVTDVDTRHVVHGEDSHRHAPLLQRAVDFGRRGALQHAALGFAAVRIHHAVADEAIAHLRDDAGLPDPLGQLQRRDHDVGRGLRGLDDFQQLHHVGGTEEMQSDDVLRAPGHGRDLVDIQGRGVGSEDRSGLGYRVQPGEDFLLQREVLEHRLDDEVGIAQRSVIQGWRDQLDAFVELFRFEAAARDRALVILADRRHAAIEIGLGGIDQGDRNADVDTAHRDAAAHGAGADDAHARDRPRRDVAWKSWDLAHFALGVEEVAQRLGLGGLFELR